YKVWAEFFPWAEYWYNTSFRGQLNAPRLRVYGQRPPSLARFVPGETLVEVVARDLMSRGKSLKQLKFSFGKGSKSDVKFANRHRKPLNITVGVLGLS
ncbi:Ty3/gypsy retrotransposon protein, partial [Trifolium pratense]